MIAAAARLECVRPSLFMSAVAVCAVYSRDRHLAWSPIPGPCRACPDLVAGTANVTDGNQPADSRGSHRRCKSCMLSVDFFA
jgi:hypothetical protein